MTETVFPQPDDIDGIGKKDVGYVSRVSWVRMMPIRK